MRGEVKEPGYVFDLEDGELGPHQTKMLTHETLDVVNDARRILPQYADEPLYDVWDGRAWVKPAAPEGKKA